MRYHHLLRFTFLVTLFSVRCFSSSEGRTMPLSLCSSWHTVETNTQLITKPLQVCFFYVIFFQFWQSRDVHVWLAVCLHACVWACKQKWGSYIRAVWLIAGQFLKKLKCGHAPHVTAQRGFRFKATAGNSTSFLSFLNLISGNFQMCTRCHTNRTNPKPNDVCIFSHHLRFVTASGLSLKVSLWPVFPVVNDPRGM